MRNLRHLTLTPKPRVLGSSPSTPGCEIPRKPFRHWLPGVFPCVQILGVSVMVLPFFARFCLVFHRRSIKNAPRFLAEGGKGVVTVRLAGTCGERSSEDGGRSPVGGKLTGCAPFLRKRQSTGRPRAGERGISTTKHGPGFFTCPGPSLCFYLTSVFPV